MNTESNFTENDVKLRLFSFTFKKKFFKNFNLHHDVTNHLYKLRLFSGNSAEISEFDRFPKIQFI